MLQPSLASPAASAAPTGLPWSSNGQTEAEDGDEKEVFHGEEIMLTGELSVDRDFIQHLISCF